MPIGFGTTPGGLEYDELKSKNFYIYHDHRTPAEAKLTLHSLEAIKPILEKWFGIKRDSPLPVIVSATTANASFANFITDALELQTMGLGTRDLAWHEYVHSTMYRHFDNWLGPAGSILHLMWLPSWFVEGLAEALSMSTGSDQMAAIERYHALTGDWPSYEKLHSLYTKADFSFRGYATSGALVSYLLANADVEKFPDFLADYFFKSMPWWWPYSILPLDSMPLDRALNNYIGVNGEDLYERYKKDATRYWQSQARSKLWASKRVDSRDFGLTHTLQARGNDVYKLEYEDGELFETRVHFKNNWAKNLETITNLGDEETARVRITQKNLQVVAVDTYDMKARTGFELRARKSSAHDWVSLVRRPGFIDALYDSGKHLYWLEQAQEKTTFCSLSKKLVMSARPISNKAVRCLQNFNQPNILSVLGAKLIPTQGNYFASEIWLKVKEQTLGGDRYKILRFNTASAATQEFSLPQGGEPLATAFAGDKIWLLVAERHRRSLRNVDAAGNCQSVYDIDDLALGLQGTRDGSLIMPIFAGDDIAILRLSSKDLEATRACYPADEHTSPLLYALNAKGQKNFKEAIAFASLHYKPTADEVSLLAQARDTSLPLDKTPPSKAPIETTSKPAQTRLRPVFAVPWVGADSGGTQLGVLSIPLMDHMQNHTLRAYFAYGPESRFPHSQLTYTNSRYWPTLELDAFRYQTWDGSFLDDKDVERNAYLDERGGRFSSHFFFHSLNTTLSLGIKSSELKPYYGPEYTRVGTLHEPFVNVAYLKTMGAYSFNVEVDSASAPESINDDFDYNTAGFNLGMARVFDSWDGVLGLGVEGSRTRGRKPRTLQEVYRPLKIFVPGSGGGFNNLNFPIAGGGDLFDATYGNNQARARANLTFPLIPNVDQLVRLFYLDRLDFTAFFNYGGAWRGAFTDPPTDTFVAAHGYNLDLQFDIKGINFNVGGGVGQVVENPFEVYMTFGFDAIIN